MSYVSPPDFVGKMIEAGETKALMSTRDTLIRAFMAGAVLALSAAFAVTITVQTGNPLLGAVLFPVGFCLLYLMGFDLLTGVFTLVPLALLDKRRGVTVRAMFRNWGLVFLGNLGGALLVALLMAIVFTYGFSVDPERRRAATRRDRSQPHRRVCRTRRRRDAHPVHPRVLCNWMVSTGVVAAMMSTSVSARSSPCGCRSCCSSTWASNTPWSTCSCSRPG